MASRFTSNERESVRDERYRVCVRACVCACARVFVSISCMWSSSHPEHPLQVGHDPPPYRTFGALLLVLSTDASKKGDGPGGGLAMTFHGFVGGGAFLGTFTCGGGGFWSCCCSCFLAFSRSCCCSRFCLAKASCRLRFSGHCKCLRRSLRFIFFGAAAPLSPR